MINREDTEALRDLCLSAAAIGIPLLLVGAGARLLMLDWKYGLPERRTTRDWDVAVEVPDWKTFLGLKSALTENGTFRETPVQHRLIHRSGTQVDLVPFGGVEASDGTITWPGEETSMTVLGLREAHANADSVEVEQGLSLPVVTVPFLVF